MRKFILENTKAPIKVLIILPSYHLNSKVLWRLTLWETLKKHNNFSCLNRKKSEPSVGGKKKIP